MKPIIKTLLVFCLAFYIFGCSPPPNLRPFAEQTADMSSAIGQSFTQVETALSEADIQREQVKNLVATWESTEKTLEALVDYSDRLVSVAEAGYKGEKAVDAIAEGLKAISKTFDLVALPSTAIDAVSKGVKFIDEQILRVEKTRSLKNAVGAAQPAIDTIANLITRNLDDLNTINTASGDKWLNDHREQHESIVEYYEALVKRDSLALRELTAITQYNSLKYQLSKTSSKEEREKIERRAKFLFAAMVWILQQ